MTAGQWLNTKRIWAIMKKEFVQLWRDKMTLKMIIGVPIMQMLLFGYAINSDPKHLPTAVVAQDHSIFARDILTGLENSDYFSITHEVDTQKARQLLQEGEVLFVVTVPELFSRSLVRGERPVVLIEADGTDPIAVANALGAVEGLMQQVIGRDTIGVVSNIAPSPQPYEVRIHRLYNPEALSRYNVIPGLIAIVLTMTGVMMTALALTRERERGTMENLLSMPVKPIEVMAGKIAPYVIIGYIQTTIIVVTAVILFGVPILGSLPLLALGALIFIICNLALGFTLSAGAKNQIQAMQMSIFVILPSVLLSGFIFPFLGMPAWAQALGSTLPSTYFIRIVRGIMLKGADAAEVWPHIWPLLIFMVVVTAIAMKVYRRTLD